MGRKGGANGVGRAFGVSCFVRTHETPGFSRGEKSSDRMFLEDPQIDLPYSLHAAARGWAVYSLADQGVRLFVSAALASPSPLFQIDDHPNHAQIESGSRFGNLAY